MGLRLVIITHRDAFQSKARYKGDYEALSNIICISPETLKALGVPQNSYLRVSNPYGEMIVKVKADPSCPQGYGFIPLSRYVNKLTSYEPERSPLPNFKGMEVMAEPWEGNA
jgi:formylmethanofuran dehydrogenase subunit D